MNILFVHQNFPAQFLHLSAALEKRGHRVVALMDQKNFRRAPIREVFRYPSPKPAVDLKKCRLGKTYTEMSERGFAALRAARALRDREGFMPDVVFGHTGWGETLFLRDVWPSARHLAYAEFYYAASGLDTDFDPEFHRPSDDQLSITTSRQAHIAHAMAQADAALAPTRWQAASFPPCFRDAITVIHDGVRTDRLCPDPAASVTLPDGTVLHAGDEVLTFVSRNLEPYRGFHVFMRALPEVLAARPGARVVLVGGDGVSYGTPPADGGSWKQALLDELGGHLDLGRVHFTGHVSYPTFTALMQVSRVHAYLTYPFVLSWSLLEAMSAGAHVVVSDTPPLAEVIEDGKTGQIVDFFDVKGWAARLIEGLADPRAHNHLRDAARAQTVARYDLERVCLPRLVEFVESQGVRSG